MTDFKVFRPQRRMIALGLAVNRLMSQPAFQPLGFGDWSKTLAGLINRDHYFFAIDQPKQVPAGRIALQNQDCRLRDSNTRPPHYESEQSPCKLNCRLTVSSRRSAAQIGPRLARG